MPNLSNKIGKRLETLVTRMLQGFPVARSGAGTYKLDVTDQQRFVISCKGTKEDGMRITKDMIREAEAGARGTRGTGDGYKPALAIGLGIGTDDEVVGFFVLGESWVEVMTRPPEERPLTPSKAASRLARVR